MEYRLNGVKLLAVVVVLYEVLDLIDCRCVAVTNMSSGGGGE